MALNLWKLGGQPTSYNSLPIGTNNRVELKNTMDYVIRLKVKSISNASFQIITYLGSYTIKTYNLTNEFMTVEYELPKCDFIRLLDQQSKGDIIIQDIQLVEKPLGKVKINKHAKALVPKKNLIPNDDMVMHDTTYRYVFVELEGGKRYKLSSNFSMRTIIRPHDDSVTLVSQALLPFDFTPPKTELYKIYLRFDGALWSGDNKPSRLGLKLYDPLLVINPPSRKGLVMDGNTYIQLPSLTMDSIEIDCLIDNDSINGLLFDLRTGLANGYVYAWGQNGSGIYSVSPSVKTTGERISFIANFPVITDDVVLFSNHTHNSLFVKGTIYKIKCYLNGEVVWESDFTKPHEGNILHNGGEPDNLLPSLDSWEWNLHANFKVLGKDVGELVASSSKQESDAFVVAEPNTSYKFLSNKGLYIIQAVDENKNYLFNHLVDVSTGSFVTDGNTRYLRVVTRNATSGTFTFQQPKLIKVSQTGSIVGNVNPQVKKAKRVLIAKR